jgi:hypothetical protein
LLGGVDPGGDRGEDRAEPVDHLCVSADHQTEAAIETLDAAAHADVDVIDAFRLHGTGVPRMCASP